jgi:bacterioferritin
MTIATVSSLCQNVGMKGNAKVLEQLNRALREELTAINQYFVHSEMDENWGYERLAKSMKKLAIDEMKHAETLIERILFLDGSPHMEPLALSIGKTVKDSLANDMKLELDAVKMYNEAAKIATEQNDHGSRDLIVKILREEEKHVDFFEAQLHEIGEMGYERYLSTQNKEEE